VFAYHARTRHLLERYAPGPETLDWTEQPDPFREFSGSPRVSLPLSARHIDLAFAQLHATEVGTPQALSLDSLGALLELSMGLSAWKEHGPDRWAVRCNPSSGNLHPTEAYVLCERVPGLDDGVYHYVSRDHALERRCTFDTLPTPRGGALWLGLSSIQWREAWKYGERAFRYCQLDIGHAIGALRYAAATLGWTLHVVGACDDARLAGLLGLDRGDDFAGAEQEEPDLLLAVIPAPAPGGSRLEEAARAIPVAAQSNWHGRANVLDPHPMYRWPVIREVTAATVSPPRGQPEEPPDHAPHPRSRSGSKAAAIDVIRNRRSAQRFDRSFTLGAEGFFHLLDCLLLRPALPWDVWRHAARVHPLLFVHRVAGLPPGLYALPRRPEAERTLRRCLHGDFRWQRVDTAAAQLPLFHLSGGDFRQFAKTVSCHQAIAGDSSFSLAMLAEFAGPVAAEPWRYRQLHWEAGLLGQVLYLEAEAMGLRGTGIGCYFDDALHAALGLQGDDFQSLYHFTVGRALIDERIRSSPPYPDRAR
jgi:SagB-type dehydrogenase family enzyme